MAPLITLCLSLLLSLASGVAAQTPEGFSPSAQAHLNVAFGNITISPPGLLVPRADTALAPTISAPSGVSNGTCIIFIVDLDVPRNGTKVTLLHWFAPNLSFASYPSNLTLLNTTTTIPGAPYLQPSPPAGSGPHRYVEVLFVQPPGFAVPEQYASISPPENTSARIGFNLTNFAAAAGLGEPVAGNYFQVVNNSPTTTSTGSATMSATTSLSATSSVVPFEGEALRLGAGRWRELWLAFGLGVVGAGIWLM